MFGLGETPEERAPGQPDAARRLTKKGRRQAQRLAVWLGARKVEAQAIVTSPLIRARETAEPIAAAFGLDLKQEDRLAGGALTMARLAALLSDAGDPSAAILVGHEPDLSEIIRDLTGGAVEMRKAALALVTCERIAAEAGVLCWLLPPRTRD